MPNVPGQLRWRGTKQFTPTFRAEYTDRTDTGGHDHVAVNLQNQPEGGPRQEFTTDLDRLEAVLKRAEAYRKGRDPSGPSWHTEQVGDYKAGFTAWPPNGTPDRVAIHLEQKKDGGTQAFTTDTERLKSAVDFGKGVEQELGYNQRWHNLVYADSIRTGDDGQVQGRVFKSVESPEQARKLLAGNGGLALYGEPSRRPLEMGAEMKLSRDASVMLSNGYSRGVEAHVADNQLSREVLGEHYVVAKWNDVSRSPGEGDRVQWDGSNRAYNGAPDDFRARPVGAGEQGEPGEPMYVLIHKGQGGLPGQGTVMATSASRKEMTARLDRAETLQRDLTTDWWN